MSQLIPLMGLHLAGNNMTTKLPTADGIADALALLHKAHQQLLDSNNYGADVLVYRAILCLSEANSHPASPPERVTWQTANAGGI